MDRPKGGRWAGLWLSGSGKRHRYIMLCSCKLKKEIKRGSDVGRTIWSVRKGKDSFVKDNMTGDNDTARGDIETTIAFVVTRIT
jgi:hypothetical protein